MRMYVAKRLVGTLGLLVVMSYLIFTLIGLMPGDPLDVMASNDPDMTSEDVARLRALAGLDQPLTERYLGWLGRALQGDFGYSRLYNQPVIDILAERLVNTAWLMGLSFALSIAIAIPAGIIAAQRPGGLIDGGINLLAFAGYSLPSFWLALLLIILFAVDLGWLPAGGVKTIGGPEGWAGLLDRLYYLILPVMTLTILSAGTFLRFVRAAMIEAMRGDYIRTARAKGCSKMRVIWFHALGNALIPVVTIIALSFGTLFSGALVIETIFSYLGMGKLIYDAIIGSDYNLALMGLMLATAVTLLANLCADMAYGWLDPRIDYER